MSKKAEITQEEIAKALENLDSGEGLSGSFPTKSASLPPLSANATVYSKSWETNASGAIIKPTNENNPGIPCLPDTFRSLP